jgi:hypothetical protein
MPVIPGSNTGSGGGANSADDATAIDSLTVGGNQVVRTQSNEVRIAKLGLQSIPLEGMRLISVVVIGEGL